MAQQEMKLDISLPQGVSQGRKWGGSSGTSRLHTIKARLYNSNERGEEIQVARKIAKGVRRCSEFAELRGEAS